MRLMQFKRETDPGTGGTIPSITALGISCPSSQYLESTHTINPSTGKVETGNYIARQRKFYMVGGDSNSACLAEDSGAFSRRIPGNRIFPFQLGVGEVAVVCFI